MSSDTKEKSDDVSDNMLVQAIESKPSVSNMTFAHMVTVDALFFSALCYRKYGNTIPYSCVIFHYYSFVILADIGAFFLPKARRHWLNVFRCFSSFQCMQFELQMWFAGVNDGVMSEGPWPTGGSVLALRIAIAVARLLQSARLVAKFGPWICHFCALGSYGELFYRLGVSGFPPKPFDGLIMAFVVWYASWFAAQLHWCYGEDRLIAPLVNLQALMSVTNFGKTCVLHILIAQPKKRGIFQLLSTIGFLIQWPLMLEMYSNAIIPYGHAVAELDAIASVVASFGAPDVPLLYQTYDPVPQDDTLRTPLLNKCCPRRNGNGTASDDAP